MITLCDALVLEQMRAARKPKESPGVGDSVALRLVAKTDKCSRKQKRNQGGRRGDKMHGSLCPPRETSFRAKLFPK